MVLLIWLDRYKYCVSVVETILPLPIARAYAEEYLPPGSRVSMT